MDNTIVLLKENQNIFVYVSLSIHFLRQRQTVNKCRSRSDAASDQGLHYFLQAYEPPHEISNNVVCATSKASDQPAHMRSLIRAFASRLHIL